MKDYINTFFSLFCGVLFGFGLILSEMINPEKIRAFLDIFGNWDLTLGFVMLGALSVTIPTFYLLKNRNHCLIGAPITKPPSKQIDRALLQGATMFGIGWGLVGLCPGPTLTTLLIGNQSIYYFAVSMVVGMYLYEFGNKIKDAKK